MPLSEPAARRDIHHRVLDMRAFARDDGLYDVEAQLVDTKPFAFERLATQRAWPAGEALHDLRVRITVDGDYVVRAIEAASDVTPFGLCKEAEATLQVLVGQRIERGWSAVVKERLRGAASCTHLMEMLIPLASTAMQGIRGLKPRSERIGGAANAAAKIDSCYAYGREREVVQRLWPQLHNTPHDTGS
jgi:hypothetical protein